MNSTQKIKKITILLILILLMGVLSIFYLEINLGIQNILFDKLSIVSSRDKLLVHFVSIGQGDAVVINLPNGKIVMIDTGPKTSNVTLTKYLNTNVINSKHDKTIDYLILTHADIDHIGGTLRVLKNYDVDKLYLPKLESDSMYYKELADFVDGRYEYDFLDDEDVLSVGDCDFKVLSSFDYNTTNKSSAVVKLEYLGRSFLFTGDIDSDVESDLIDVYGDRLDCDVLKVAHHGSKYSTSYEFLNYVTPSYSVVSVGDNYYGHPHDETIDRILASGGNLLRTDSEGSILFVVGENFDLNVLSGTYVVIGMNLDIRYFCLIIVGISTLIIIKTLITKKIKRNK